VGKRVAAAAWGKPKLEKFGQMTPRQKWQTVKWTVIGLGIIIVLVTVGPVFLPPRIEVAFPGNNSVENPLDSQIEIIFDRGMNKAAVVKNFSISPKVAGAISWESNRKLVFVPEKPLVRGQSYV